MIDAYALAVILTLTHRVNPRVKYLKGKRSGYHFSSGLVCRILQPTAL